MMNIIELKDEVLDFIELNKIDVDSDILFNFVLEHRLRAIQEYQSPLQRAKRITHDIVKSQT